MTNLRYTARWSEQKRGCIFAEDFISLARLAFNGGAITGAGAVVSKGLTVDGTQYATFDDIETPQTAVSAVVRFSADAVSTGILFGNQNLITGTPAAGFCIWVDINGIWATYSDGSDVETPVSIGLDYADGVAHTITYVIGSGDHALYVDDVSATASATTPAPVSVSGAMAGGDGTDNFVGTVYQARIFDAELTEAEHAVYHAGTLTNTLLSAWAAYGCDTFGHDTVGHRIWDNLDSAKDLIKGDGVLASTFPILADHIGRHCQFYVFDGLDDYVSHWPTMTAGYTVSALVNTAGIPAILQCNDATIKNLLTAPGAFEGSLYNLAIFDRVLTALEKFEIEYQQKRTAWRAGVIDPALLRLIESGVGIQVFRFDAPGSAYTDFSSLAVSPTATALTWADGIQTTGGTSKLTVPDGAGLRSADVSIVVCASEFIDGTVLQKGANYDLRVSNSGKTIDFNGETLIHTAAPVFTWAVTCRDGEAPRFYADGVYVGAGASVVAVDDTDTGALTIANLTVGGAEFNVASVLKSLVICSTILTPAEVKLAHSMLGRGFDFENTAALVVSVDADDSILAAQTDVIIDCSNAGAAPGRVYLADAAIFGLAAVRVEQTVTAWAEDEITFDVVPGAL